MFDPPRFSREMKRHALFLAGELWLPNLVTSEDDIECALHLAQETLIGCGSTTLEIRDDGRCSVALLRQILLCHGRALVVLRLRARLANRLADYSSDSLGLHNVVGTINLGQALTL
jgi:hypothetical protein